MERYGDETALLVAQTGPLNGQRWPLRKTTVIGREPDCDIVIPDRQVSRRHARIHITKEGIYLEDLGSKNGTFRNGARLEDPAILSDGDLVQISLAQHFVFLSSDATVPLEMDILPEKGAMRCRLYLDHRSRRVWVGGKELAPPLSVPQFRLLQALYEQPGEVVERQDLINFIWGEDESIGVSEQAFDALVRRLRDRLGLADPGHEYIITMRGHGLRFDNPSQE